MNTSSRVIKVALAAALVVSAASLFATAAVAGVHYVLVVDNTGSMKHQGRGAATLEGIGELIDSLRQGDGISVYTFGEQTVELLPMGPVILAEEADRSRIKRTLSFTFTADRTDMTAGLEQVWRDRERLFGVRDATGASHRDRSRAGGSAIVFLTDGKLIPVYNDYAEYDRIYHASRARLLELADLFGLTGIPIHAVALGRSDRVDGELLAEVGARSGGSYHHAPSSAKFGAVLRAALAEARDGVLADAESLAGDAETDSDGHGDSDGVSRWFRDEASARTEPAGGAPEDRSASCPSEAPSLHCGRSWLLAGFPADFCTRAAAVLAVFIGFITIGTEKRQKWVAPFTGHLFGTGERRVRGYLRPVDRPGVNTARPNVGLENPGLDSLTAGAGTPYLSYARETIVEFVGTKDGSPPLLRVEQGDVEVGGKLITEKKLEDGDLIEIEGLAYRYFRGNRR